MSSEIFKENAPAYWEAGYSVLPIEPGTKRPAKELKSWQGYCHNIPNERTQNNWLRRCSDYGIGVLLGAEIRPGYRISAIDVDDDRLVDVTGLGPKKWSTGRERIWFRSNSLRSTR